MVHKLPNKRRQVYVPKRQWKGLGGFHFSLDLPAGVLPNRPAVPPVCFTLLVPVGRYRKRESYVTATFPFWN